MDSLKVFLENCMNCYRNDVVTEIKTISDNEKGVFFCFLSHHKVCVINKYVNGCILDKKAIELYEKNRLEMKYGD